MANADGYELTQGQCDRAQNKEDFDADMINYWLTRTCKTNSDLFIDSKIMGEGGPPQEMYDGYIAKMTSDQPQFTFMVVREDF